MTIEQLYAEFKKVKKISTDTRQIDGPCIFFALRGERFDGNQYAVQAIEKGATLAVVDDPNLQGIAQCCVVENSLSTLQDLARHHRRQFDIPFLAITGSNGKTTTKELVSGVLANHYTTHFTKGNLNNHIGVPLTLLETPDDIDIAVIEMGANHIGEIAALSAIAEPTHGLITNIGKAHLEGFGGIEGVKQGKSELYRFLAKHGGLVFINQEERFLKDLAADVEKKLFYGRGSSDLAQSDYEIQFLEETPYLKFGFLDDQGALIEVQSQLMGIYNLNNIMTAVAVGKYFKVPANRIKEAIEAYVPTNNRSQLIQHEGNAVVLDAYNANPTSMKVALTHFAKHLPHPKMAIIGDMLELGEDSYEEHLHIGSFAKQQNFDELVFVGKEFETIASDLSIRHFADVHTLKEWFQKEQFNNYHILLKASRGIGLERMLRNT